jgi:hypothetical protein
MLPNENDSRWKNLVDGKINAKFKFVAASMCVSRNQRYYRMNPGPETMQIAVKELVEFFKKYENIAQADLEEIFG